ncbi:ScbA/BarX family gamma-butyrolactone biosynthesis protein [Streptomyces sp. NPDC058459]|uniref:ScbA/BarX family gamma-butyrolactone biosynthesis protein n=1 Tax=Streptomyces sp. NPDC058459 TaxID=3346508 RepID=UPI0036639A0D
MSLAPSRTSESTRDVPRLTTTVPKEYVHRASLAEVFLTRCSRQSDTTFAVSGQWPRTHTFFQAAGSADYDPLLVAETFRQAGLFLAHAELGVPLGHHFVMRDLGFSAQLDQLHIGATPADIELNAVCTDITFRGGKATGFRMQLSIARDGIAVAAGGGDFTCISPAVYQRLRGNRPLRETTHTRDTPYRAIPPTSVGRTQPLDVVLSPTRTPQQWLLTPSLDHPVLYDHAGDHHPGMVLLEAARQAACALAGPPMSAPSAIATTFHRYAEIDEPCVIEAAPALPQEHHMTSIRVTGRQGGQPIFTSLLTAPPRHPCLQRLPSPRQDTQPIR